MYRLARELAAYTLTAYGIAYLLDYTFILPLLKAGRVLAATPLLVARMAAPALGAFAAYASAGRPGNLRDWLGLRVSGAKLLLAASAVAVVAYALSIPLSMAAGLRPGLCGPLALLDLRPALAITVSLLSGVAAGLTVNTLAALGEEMGWRGYLLWRLGGLLGFWPAAILVGVIWGLWHAPLVLAGYNYMVEELEDCGPGALGLEALLAFTIYTAAAGLVAAELRRMSGGSIAPAAFHGTINGVAGLFASLILGSRLIAPPAGLSVAASMALLAVAMAMGERLLGGGG